MSQLAGYRCNRCKRFVIYDYENPEELPEEYSLYQIPKNWLAYEFNNQVPQKHLCDWCVKELEL